MNCPKCGKEMLRGSMHTQKYPFWTQQELRFFKAPTDLVELGHSMTMIRRCSRTTRFRSFPMRKFVKNADWSFSPAR